ncbi:MAG TPA: AAA family ATPase [Solirubrobacteraceae bacterium]|nr:AAA family ATPase [Solirubrobacteraceae bacterium]
MPPFRPAATAREEAGAPADPSARSVCAEVMALRWSAPEGGFAVVAALTDDGEEVTLTGTLDHLHEGEVVDVEGSWRRHARHGWRFEVERVRSAEPASEAALLNVLAGVRHVGPSGAAWLLDHHGPDVLEIVDRDPRARLREVPGIGPARIGAAVRSWERLRGRRALRLFLSEHGVPAAAASRIERAFGPEAIDRLRAEPYAAAEVDGVGFATADALARALGTGADAPERLDAGVLHALEEAGQDGNCLLPRAELARRARALLGADVAGRIDDLVARGRLVADGDLVADPAMDRLERRLAARVRALVEDDAPLRLARVERPVDGDFAPTDAQWAVVDAVLASRLAILTGGPGTGKTATMRALVDLVRSGGRSVRLCAPTGKAARRLGEATGAQATTIHRLLGWVPGEGFERGPEDPIPGADVLVVDEASMLSVGLADALLGAVGPRTHVLLVGDVDQLAPVGPGRVLQDLIASGVVPTVRLTEIFRQAARSLIVRAAHAINAGEPPPAHAGPGDLRDFFVIAHEAPEAMFEEVVGLAAERLPAHYGLQAICDVLVLSPMHRGPVGVDALNAALRARLNPGGAPIPGTVLRVGDRVIQTRNDHERELMNGELGVLAHHDRERDRVLLACDDGRRIALGTDELGTLRLAHAITVHKAQGSQAPAVVVPVFRGHHVLLTRNLLYTAVTRAERVCVLVVQPDALRTALARVDTGRRHTRLARLVAG